MVLRSAIGDAAGDVVAGCLPFSAARAAAGAAVPAAAVVSGLDGAAGASAAPLVP